MSILASNGTEATKTQAQLDRELISELRNHAGILRSLLLRDKARLMERAAERIKCLSGA